MPTPRRYANHAERQAAYRKRVAHASQQPREAGSMPAPPPIPSMPGWRRWDAMTQHALRSLHTAQEEMQEYYDLKSETWQASDRGEAFLERLQALEDVVAAVDGLPSPT